MLVTQDPVNNSILSLHLGIRLWLKGRGMVRKFSQNGTCKLGNSYVSYEEQAF